MGVYSRPLHAADVKGVVDDSKDLFALEVLAFYYVYCFVLLMMEMVVSDDPVPVTVTVTVFVSELELVPGNPHSVVDSMDLSAVVMPVLFSVYFHLLLQVRSFLSSQWMTYLETKDPSGSEVPLLFSFYPYCDWMESYPKKARRHE